MPLDYTYGESPIDQQECAVFRLPDGADHFVVNLYAFFDDSGTDDRSPLIACAGYLALGSRWNAFSRKWRHLLRSYHVPLNEFSMKKYAQFRGPFERWPEERRRSFMAHALKLIQAYVEHGFGGILRKSDYDNYLSESVKLRVGGYFPFCAEMCIGMVEAYAAIRSSRSIDATPTEFIDFIFEKGTVGAGAVHAAFEGFYWGLDRMWFRDFSTETKDAAELHAADVLAYELRKNVHDLNLGKADLRHPFKMLLLGVPHFIIGPQGEEVANMDAQLRITYGL